MNEVLESPAAVQAAELVKMEQLQAAPWNSRTEADYGDVQGLADSIKAEGLLQALTVRPAGAKLEVVCGHRRLRAVQLLGWPEVPVVTRALSDDEARIVATTENLQRENINAIAQAEGFQALTKKPFNLSPDDVGRRVGKPGWFVRQALQVLLLPEKVIAAVREGHLGWKAVAQLMRIEDRAVRERASLQLLPDKYGRGYATATDARAVAFEHMLHLQDAPFDINDATLQPEAGVCGSCPFRSGAKAQQIGLFADVTGDEADTCTKPSCWKAKADASHERAAAKARAAGHHAWPNSAKLFSTNDGNSLRHDAGVVDVDQPANRASYELGLSGQQRSVRSLLGEHLPAEAIAIVQDPAGGTRFLAKNADVKRALAKAGIVKDSGSRRVSGFTKNEAEKTSDRKKRLASEIETRTRRQVHQKLTEVAAQRKGIAVPIVRVLLEASPREARRVYEARTGAVTKASHEDSVIKRLVEEMQGGGGAPMFAVLTQLAIEIAAGGMEWGWKQDKILSLAKELGIDATSIRQAVTAECTARYKEREEKRGEAVKREKAKARKAKPASKAATKAAAPAPRAKAVKKGKRKAA